MLVKLKHGTCNYEGSRKVAGDEYEITQRYYDANYQRYEIINVEPEVSIQNVMPEEKPAAEVFDLETTEAPKQDYQSGKKNKKNK